MEEIINSMKEILIKIIPFAIPIFTMHIIFNFFRKALISGTLDGFIIKETEENDDFISSETEENDDFISEEEEIYNPIKEF